MLESEIQQSTRAKYEPFYEPLRAFSLALACVAWAEALQRFNAILAESYPNGAPYHVKRIGKQEYASWSIKNLAPCGYRLVSR